LDAHIEEYKSAFLTTVFNQDKNDANFRTMQGKTENLRAYLDGKIDQMYFELSQKVRVDDMRQNFKQFNDLLFIKFKQLEDTKEAVRNLISY